jgi:hypothetical protein
MEEKRHDGREKTRWKRKDTMEEKRHDGREQTKYNRREKKQ